MSSNNIIEFPRKKIVRDVPVEQVEEGKTRGLQYNIENIIDDIGTELIVHLNHYGIETSGDLVLQKDLLFVYDLLRAIVYRKHGLEHHLHGFLDKNVTISPLKELLPEKFIGMPPMDGFYGDDMENEETIKKVVEVINKKMDGNTAFDIYPSDSEPPEQEK